MELNMGKTLEKEIMEIYKGMSEGMNKSANIMIIKESDNYICVMQENRVLFQGTLFPKDDIEDEKR